MYSGALSGTVKMLATDELDQPYWRLRLLLISEAVVQVQVVHRVTVGAVNNLDNQDGGSCQ
jgi:hypothetical protein